MGKKSSKSKSSSKPWKPAQPYLLGAANTIQNTVNANQGNLDSIAGDLRGILPNIKEMAFGPNAGLDAANNYATDVLGGKFLNNNPYIDDMAGLARENALDTINNRFASAGRVGGSDHMEDLGRGISQAELGVRYQNYGNERNAQTQAAGMIPGLNASQYAGIMPYLATAQGAAGVPYMGLGALSGIGNLFGGYGTQTQTQPGGWGQGLLGAAVGLGSAALSNPAIFASSRDLKDDIEVMGPWDDRGDGLEKVSFRYRSDPTRTRYIGVIAEQVKELRPWAYVPNFVQGKAGVNYAKLSEAA